MSSIPAAADVLELDIDVLTLPDVAAKLGMPITRVHQAIRDNHLVAIRRDGVVVVPAVFFDAENAIVKGLPGTITVLSDSGFTRDDIVRWLFTEDDSLPGTPIDALRGDRGREVKRRAQALAF